MSETGANPLTAKKASDDAAGVTPKAATTTTDPFAGAVDYLDDNYGTSTSSGKCTKAIKQALDGQELNGTTYDKSKDGSITGRDFIDKNGEKLGYSSVASGTLDATNAKSGPEGYTPQKGDIAVFDPTDEHKYGHIEMYDGSQWRSDFKQNNFSPGSGYTKDGVPYTIYRNGAKGTGAGQSETSGTSGKAASKGSTAKAGETKSAAKAPAAKKVTNHGKQIVTTTTGHTATTKTPTDVHHKKVKPEITAPFKNYVGSDKLVNPSILTLIDRGKIWLGPISHLIPSLPNHASFQPGVKTKRYKDEARATSWSTDLFIESFLCVRTDDKTTQNFANTKGVVVGKQDAAKKGKGKQAGKAKAKRTLGKHTAAELNAPLKGKVTVEQLQAIAPGTPRAKLEAAVGPLNDAMEKNGINTKGRAAAFLAQAAHESGGFNATSENLNYSAKGLEATWPKRFDAESAAEYARKPEAIANHVYGGRMGNGDEASGDGWTYRGGGYIQTTGKNNYTSYGASQGMTASEAAAYVRTPEGAADSAGYYWSQNNLNSYADKGDIKGMTQVINGGQKGYDDRVDRYEAGLEVL